MKNKYLTRRECQDLEYLKDLKKEVDAAVEKLILKDETNRDVLFRNQRETRGWDDSELWCLATSHAKWAAPRFKRFAEITCGSPVSLEKKEWKTIILKVAKAFELLAKEDGARNFNEKESKQVDVGLELYHKHYYSFWF